MYLARSPSSCMATTRPMGNLGCCGPTNTRTCTLSIFKAGNKSGCCTFSKSTRMLCVFMGRCLLLARRRERLFDLAQYVACADRNRRARAVDAMHTGGVQKIVVLARNHPADEHDDVVGPLRLERGNDGRHQRFVAGGQRGHA